MAKQITEKDGIYVGEIIYYNTGYSMVIPHFAIVDSFTASGKSVRCRELGTTVVSDDGYGQSGQLVPDPTRRGKLKTYRIANIEGRPYVRIEGHWSCEWNGRPVMFDYLD